MVLFIDLWRESKKIEKRAFKTLYHSHKCRNKIRQKKKKIQDFSKYITQFQSRTFKLPTFSNYISQKNVFTVILVYWPISLTMVYVINILYLSLASYHIKKLTTNTIFPCWTIYSGSKEIWPFLRRYFGMNRYRNR